MFVSFKNGVDMDGYPQMAISQPKQGSTKKKNVIHPWDIVSVGQTPYGCYVLPRSKAPRPVWPSCSRCRVVLNWPTDQRRPGGHGETGSEKQRAQQRPHQKIKDFEPLVILELPLALHQNIIPSTRN